MVDGALLLFGLIVGLTFAAHGCRNAYGWWGGPGMQGWQGQVAAMGFRPPGLFATASITAELVGGLALAIGLLTPLAAALLVAQSLVIVLAIHWPNGFWNADRGIEYPLVLAGGVVALGLAGRGLVSVDGVIGFAPPPSVVIALLLVGMVAGAIASNVPRPVRDRRPADQRPADESGGQA